MTKTTKAVSMEVKTNKDHYSQGEEVKISLSITNTTSKPVTLLFTTTQHYDIKILKTKKEIWQWSENRMFAMTTESIILQEGEKQTYTETWSPKNLLPGKYIVYGTITSQPPHANTHVIHMG